jgi:hypothetical protein
MQSQGGIDQSQQLIARAVYMAQLAAAQGNCQCSTCKILRKVNGQMVGAFLQTPTPAVQTQGLSPEMESISLGTSESEGGL